MPFTFFAHQTIVVPLKWARPRWFDGTALCVGSMAPDLSYVLDDTRFHASVHTVPAQLYWTLPLATALTLVWRHVVAAPLGAAVPGVLGREISALARAHRPWWQTALGTVLGGLSHVFMDGFTHSTGWAARRIAVLRTPVVLAGHRQPVAEWLQLCGHTVGTALGFAMLAWLVRHRRFSQWAELPAPAARAAPHRLAMGVPVALGVALGLGLAAGLPGEPGTRVMRAAWAAFAGLVIGSGLARRAA